MISQAEHLRVAYETLLRANAATHQQLMTDLARQRAAWQASSPRAQWVALVASFEARGMSKVDAIKAAARAQPALYNAQAVPLSVYTAR